MSAENLKWRVNRAVCASNLPAPARLIMLVLSDMADAKTGIIPDRQATSNADLARKTGLGDSTVKAQLALLESLGWVVRSRPDAGQRARHVSSGYQIQVGSAGEKREPLKRAPRARSKPSDETSEGQEQALAEGQDVALENETEGQEQANRGPGDSSPRARSKPSYIKDDDPYDPYDLKAAADAAAEGDAQPPKKRTRKPRASPKPPTAAALEAEARRQKAEEIVRWWWNGLDIKPAGEKAWHVCVASVAACLKVGWEAKDVANALRAAGVPVTIARLEVVLNRYGRPPRPPQSNDQHLADEMAWAQQLEAEEAARQTTDPWEGFSA